MNCVESLNALYASYIGTVESLIKNRKIGDGLFGFGNRVGNDPCHTRFAEDIAKLLADFRKEGPEAPEVYEVLKAMYEAPLINREPASAYWMLVAVHALTKELIPLLSPEGAVALRAFYEESYPRRERLPAQKQVFSALKARAKNG